MSAEWASVIAFVFVAVVGWILWAITQKKKTRERLRTARPSFEDFSIQNPIKGEANDRRMEIVNNGGTANAIEINENEFISTETKRVHRGSTLTLIIDEKLFKGRDFLGEKKKTRISYEDDYGTRYTKTIVFFYERPKSARYMNIRFEECEDN